MGTFGITYGLVGKALAIGGGTATITPTSAWEFENQSGTLGTNLTGSSIYSGTGGNIVGILSGATVAVTFNAVPAGTILPVAFDYILSGPADMVALK